MISEMGCIVPFIMNKERLFVRGAAPNKQPFLVKKSDERLVAKPPSKQTCLFINISQRQNHHNHQQKHHQHHHKTNQNTTPALV